MTRTPRTLCVFCGSRNGTQTPYANAAERLGHQLAKSHVRLVYGGGGVGLMGLMARAVLAKNGTVVGIVPRFLRELEVQQNGLTELVITETMHERKRLMYDMSDAFAVLPGGIGTLEEISELMSWRHLNVHSKPIVLVNIENYWRPYLDLLDHMIEQDFAVAAVRGEYRVVDRIEDILTTAGLTVGAEA